MKEILLAHGGGGEETRQLIESLFVKHFGNPMLERLEDAAIISGNPQLAFTTDSFTVSPLFFNGGNIGKLAVAGTVNDLAVMGARPLYLSSAFIIEEGFPFEHLQTIVASMAEELQKSGATIITGDTKVVPRGSADGVFINTTGIGQVVYPGLSAGNVQPGDVLVVSGTVGDHGACILAQREGIELESDLQSDCATLWPLIEMVLTTEIEIHAMRDPTRGGLAAVLNEWATTSQVGMDIQEAAIPIRQEVMGLCELLGMEATSLACEGRVVFAVPQPQAEALLAVLHTHPLGRDAQIIGTVTSAHPGQVILHTEYGARRILEPPQGELLPRIC